MIHYNSMSVIEAEELIRFLYDEHDIDPLIVKNALESVKDGEYTLFNRSIIRAFIRAWRNCQKEKFPKSCPMIMYEEFIAVFDSIFYIIEAGFLPEQFLLHLSS